MIDVQRVDYIRVPVTDMEKANHFYGDVLGLERNPNSPGEDWVEYETGNVTLAVMTPHTHDYEFTPLPPGTIALRVPDVAEAKAKLEAAGVQVNEMWDSGVCHGAGGPRPGRQRHPPPPPLRPLWAALTHSPRPSGTANGAAQESNLPSVGLAVHQRDGHPSASKTATGSR